MRQELQELISCSPLAVLKSLEHFNAALASTGNQCQTKNKIKIKKRYFAFNIEETVTFLGEDL
tara:strand:+ start:127 stop:315 length:189 start_codon:yes stop_codon:yes gene_type:complete